MKVWIIIRISNQEINTRGLIADMCFRCTIVLWLRYRAKGWFSRRSSTRSVMGWNNSRIKIKIKILCMHYAIRDVNEKRACCEDHNVRRAIAIVGNPSDKWYWKQISVGGQMNFARVIRAAVLYRGLINCRLFLYCSGSIKRSYRWLFNTSCC